MDFSGPIVRFEDVDVHGGDGRQVLTGLSFDLEAGSFHFLTGGSGAGKSMLLKTIYLGLLAKRGTVSLFGEEISAIRRVDLPALRRRIGIVFQDIRLIENLTVMENVTLALEIAGAPGRAARGHVGELLDWVGLADRAGDKPGRLSGGERQLVAIARAVITNPDLLVADEPTCGIERNLATRVLYLFEELNRMGTSVLIATHDDELALRYDYPRLHLRNGGLSMHTGH